MMSEPAATPLFRYDLPIDQDPIHRLIDRRIPWATHGDLFSYQWFGAGPSLEQGWKLHISATPLSAVAVLEASLDVLFAEGARFKVVNTIARLATLNSGQLAPSQIGKFITVYPSNDAQAIRLAIKLDEVTSGLSGPRVPTDRPLRPDSLVHYRYAAFVERAERRSGDEEASSAYDLLDPAGRLTNDLRLPYYVPPPGGADPFEAAGAYVPRPARDALLNGRFLVNNALSRPAHGGVFRAVDLGTQPPRLCILKEGWHDVGLDQYGRDARDVVANEARILSRHAGDPFLPRCYDRFEMDGNLYIAVEYLEGTSLDRALSEEHALKGGIDPADLLAIGTASANALAHLHEIDLVFRDFKPGNLLKTPDGDYRLIDFGLAYDFGTDDHPALGLGTPPYFPREQYEGGRPDPIDDVYAWGSVLHHLVCGPASLADMPKGDDRLRPFVRRPVAKLRPDFPATLAAVIDRAVAWERQDRYATMAEARDAFVAAAGEAATESGEPAAMVGVADPGPEPAVPAAADLLRPDPMALAREVGDALCAVAEERLGGLCWASRREVIDDLSWGPDLYAGAAGIGLFLAELAHATGEQRYADAARGAARWLAGPAWGRGRAQQGLHGGEPGVAYFFLRLAELLDEPGYVQAAELRVRRLRGVSFTTEDLLYGTAGSIVALLRLHTVTGESAYLAEACAAGDSLVQSAQPPPNGGSGCYWEVTSSFPYGPSAPYLGLLHGAAGIGLALASLAAARGDERYLSAANGAAELLLAQGSLSDAGAMTWPRQLGDKHAGLQAHCHGAGGVGQFFLRLNRLAPDPRYREAAEGAARTMAMALETETRSGICHGVSGAGNLLLDCYQAFGEQRWLDLAHEGGRRLQEFRDPERPGVYKINAEGAVSPDLMLGYAGAGSFFLRLGSPETAPDLILP
jgi:hypothetical protein